MRELKADDIADLIVGIPITIVVVLFFVLKAVR
jgi:hypothetical protein